VRVAFRPGHPEVSPRNMSFAALRDGGGLADDDAIAIHPAVAPAAGEVVVTKRRVLRDACADADREVHRVLLDKVFPRQAEVVDVAEWASALLSRS